METNNKISYKLPSWYIWFLRNSIKLTLICILSFESFLFINYGEINFVVTMSLVLWLVIMLIINFFNKNIVFSIEIDFFLKKIEFVTLGEKDKLIYNFEDIESVVLMWAFIFKFKDRKLKYPDYQNRELLESLGGIIKVDNKRSALM